MRKLKEAHELVDRALAIEPNGVGLLAQKAELYLAAGQVDRALLLVERAPADGQDITGFGRRIQILLYLRKFEEATKTLRAVLDAPSEYAKAFLPNYRAWLGAAESIAGDVAAAKSDLLQAQTELRALNAGGDRGPRIARDLLRTAGFLGDKLSVDSIALEMQDDIKNDALDGPASAQALAAAGRSWERRRPRSPSWIVC